MPEKAKFGFFGGGPEDATYYVESTTFTADTITGLTADQILDALVRAFPDEEPAAPVSPDPDLPPAA